MPSKRDILDLATKAVGDRGLNYGKPEDNFNRIANLWNVHLTNRGFPVNEDLNVSATDVAMMCALLKIARLQHQPDHLDSWVDLAGYAACGGEIAVRDLPSFHEATAEAMEAARNAPSGSIIHTPV